MDGVLKEFHHVIPKLHNIKVVASFINIRGLGSQRTPILEIELAEEESDPLSIDDDL